MFDKIELLYIKIAKDLCYEILSSDSPMGKKVPSVREFSKKKQVNANTVQKAYQYLDELGIFISEKGLGRYVTNDQEKIDNIKKYLVENELRHVKIIAQKFDIQESILLKWYQEISIS